MQGFIININKVRDEDLIVCILTVNKLKTTYRFYGARHSTINLGYLIDFETQMSIKTNIAQLRNVIHLAYSWNLDRDRFYFWQQFVKLFYGHLRDIENIDSFYFELLTDCAKKWQRQNPKRVIVEAYLKLLEHEGRLHSLDECFLCEEKITDDKLALARAFLPAHTECIHRKGLEISKVKKLFSTKQTILLDNEEVEYLYLIIEEGF
ncbi:MAG: recombination protein RecO [Campylobacteraceae bacterium]|jgi:recombinational DNA repair protein (RecF pathway)|nr:recombination protein RecO [Campylobacteraceae bacterium]